MKMRIARQRAGLTQEKLAQKAGVSKSTIERMENGNPCYASVLSLIAEVLRLPVDELLWPTNECSVISPAISDYNWLIILDGMTYNRVGEIIYGQPKDAIQKISSPSAYRRSLEDFVFATVFFDTLGVDSSILCASDSTVTRNRFAHAVLRDMDTKEIGSKIETVGGTVSLQLYLQGEHRKYIENDVGALRHAPWDPWKVLVERETHFLLRDNDCVLDPFLDYDQYYSERGYVADEVLCDSMPANKVKSGVKTVRNICPSFPAKTAQSFVKRTLLTHIAIGYYYHIVSRPWAAISQYQDYLPCDTRASLIRHDSIYAPKLRYTGILCLQYLLLPYCLAEVLQECSSREQFLRCLFSVREKKKYREARTILQKIRSEMKLRNFDSVKKLQTEINDAAERVTQKPLLVQRCQMYHELPDRARWAQEYVKAISRKDFCEINRKLANLFPEAFSSLSE